MDEDDDIKERLHGILNAVYDRLPANRQTRVKRRAKRNRRYVRTPRDEKIMLALDELTESPLAALHGDVGKRRALFIIGETDSGKSMAMEYHLARREEFKPVKIGDKLYNTTVMFEPPRPITLKGFARAAIRACGYPVSSNAKMTEQEWFELLADVIKSEGVLYMVIDEMQHVLKGKTTDDVQNVADIIKSLLQIKDWPLHMILMGVPTLTQFVLPDKADGQLANRSNVVELPPLSVPGDVEPMLHVMRQIMKSADLEMVGIDTPEFMERIFHTVSHAFGTTIQIIQDAADLAIDEFSETVGAEHFGRIYAARSGCRPNANVFLVENWKELKPRYALARAADGPGRTTVTRRKK